MHNSNRALHHQWLNRCARLLLIIALVCLAKASWISAKAVLAQLLIAQAWEQTLTTGANSKPWSWADTWPVAALTTPAGETLYVLAGTSGQALAFGPGLLNQSAAPGQQGSTIIAGHRDTHFLFLETLQQGDQIELQNSDGRRYHYKIEQMEIVDSSKQPLYLQQQNAELTLITCYPFHALNSGGPLRYVVHASLL